MHRGIAIEQILATKKDAKGIWDTHLLVNLGDLVLGTVLERHV